jgi:hypothetical protein
LCEKYYIRMGPIVNQSGTIVHNSGKVNKQQHNFNCLCYCIYSKCICQSLCLPLFQIASCIFYVWCCSSYKRDCYISHALSIVPHARSSIHDSPKFISWLLFLLMNHLRHVSPEEKDKGNEVWWTGRPPAPPFYPSTRESAVQRDGHEQFTNCGTLWEELFDEFPVKCLRLNLGEMLFRFMDRV